MKTFSDVFIITIPVLYVLAMLDSLLSIQISITWWIKCLTSKQFFEKVLGSAFNPFTI